MGRLSLVEASVVKAEMRGTGDRIELSTIMSWVLVRACEISKLKSDIVAFREGAEALGSGEWKAESGVSEYSII